MKTTQTIENLAQSMGWISDFPSLFIRVLGFFELLIGLAVILPRFIKILPTALISYGGYSIILVMFGAIGVHLERVELSLVLMNVIILRLAAFVTLNTKTLS